MKHHKVVKTHGLRFPVMMHLGRRWLMDFEGERFESVDESGQIIGFRGLEGSRILEACTIVDCPFCGDYLMEKPLDGRGNPFCVGCKSTIRAK